MTEMLGMFRTESKAIQGGGVFSAHFRHILTSAGIITVVHTFSPHPRGFFWDVGRSKSREKVQN